jgi:hypothetical protein
MFSIIFLNLVNIRSHTKFHKNKTMGSGRKNKQVSIGFIFIPMLHCLFLRPDPMVLFFCYMVCGLILVTLRYAVNFNGHFISEF